MRVDFSEDFNELLSQFKDPIIAKRVATIILKFENASTLREVSNVKAMSGWPGYYRISFGDFRIGFYYVEKTETVEFLAIAHRSNIYRIFP